MAIQFHQEMKDRDYPTKEPVRNPQQSNEQANPMGQLEKENPFPDPIGLTPRQRSALRGATRFIRNTTRQLPFMRRQTCH